MKFKGSGRFKNVTLLGWRSRLKHVLPWNVIVSSDDVGWFTGMYLPLFVGFMCFGLCFVMHYLVSFLVLQLP